VREAERISEELSAGGIDVLLDDRDERPGIKFKDADLCGIPLRVTLGEKNFAAGFAEIRDRRTGETERVERSRIVETAAAAVEAMRKECSS
jgi:prolyl-tRNA synthetase